VATSVTYTGVPSVREETVVFLDGLLHAERQWRHPGVTDYAGSRGLTLVSSTMARAASRAAIRLQV
jgi:hypothetical protein